ncbi:TPA: type II toxin-antitoxin system HicA family toxin [Escherichia coli]|jgi:predicted RNA binding protein YcfA (HicA-like mRNA interferase family)|uniref:type II toxin-antitoxin system HicA family toxin n=1 Tax=Escherichia coli TaxID=562 RepID=UPI00107B8ED0|nr:type II toxin-antitoxin system HicA family toxin [Escherichia coli]EAA9452752.1 type II toxin-antitoxin system HicA family toxin [Salmonella enterica subsp. enterica]EDI2356367.1 type II toxin-antitoxin system HicA family toxin [Salmonella enterica subsp. enterica serovar Heidelberg]EGP6466993.1 type II toxin-antitoxin system HicA family toxin [Salmonella enterica]EGP6740949.1 type II toxin-antitoxin system HicA family toxin [Salmonella enterica]HED5659207.1 type II toxin-antitoxin system H
MGKTDKLLAKFLNSKKMFEWDELVVLFSSLGYVKKEMQGSRVRFFNAEINHTILMHRPHPESYIKGGTLKAIKQNLKEAGLL